MDREARPGLNTSMRKKVHKAALGVMSGKGIRRCSLFSLVPSKRLFLLLVLSLLPPAVVLSGEESPLFREIIRAQSRVKTIDAEIVQYIHTPGREAEKFRGRYRADSRGRFRIDFREPERQTVLNTGTGLYWYYPDAGLLYEIGGKSAPPLPSVHPSGELAVLAGKKSRVVYMGRSLMGFLKLAHLFVIENPRKGIVLSVWVEDGRKVLLKKTVRDSRDREIIKELYGDYRDFGGIPFPCRIDVYARSNEGTVRNTTYYDNVRLNGTLEPEVFRLRLPAGTVRRQMEYR